MRRKRFTAGVLAGAMALTVTPILGFTGSAGALQPATGAGSVCADPPNAEPFTDVSDSDPSKAEITCLVNANITQGVTATTYEPNSSVTRRQMALFLERTAVLADDKDTGSQITPLPAGDGTTPYTDIANETPAVKKAVDRLDEADIAKGVTATTFVPAAKVTRRQMAKFLVRLQEFQAGAASVPTPTKDYFTDDNGDSGEKELNILAEEGVFLGDGQGNVKPGADITRRQMANVLVRKLQFFFENNDIKRLFAPAAGAGATIRPELTKAEIVRTVQPGNATPSQPAGTYIRFTFDEPVALGATAANFKVYNADSTLADLGDAASIEPGGLSVVVRFDPVLTTQQVGALSVATVIQGAVLDANGNSNPEGDAAVGSGSTSTVTAGVTNAPDVTAIAAYRQGQQVGTTAVDFTFDEAATVLNNNGFTLVLQDNTVSQCTSSTQPAVGAPSGGTVPGGSGTTTITVVCQNPDITVPNPGGTPLSAANVARGAVEAGTVQDGSAVPVQNPLQTVDAGNSGNTTANAPDLVSATLVQGTGGNPDAVLYTFDRDVTAAGVPALFNAYLSNGNQIQGNAPAQISATDAKQVLVPFASNTALDTAVGASVDPAAVTGAAATTNQKDEVAVTNATAQNVVPGKTAAPDLTGVEVKAATGFSPATATFTFDQNVEPGAANIDEADFNLYTATGVRFEAAAGQCFRGTALGADSASPSPSVTCAFGAVGDSATNSNVINAVLGTVEQGAVQDDTNTALTNPEGAERTTGGTGTPTA